MKLFYLAYEDFENDRASNWQIVNTTNFLDSKDLEVEIIFPYEFQIDDKYQLKSNTIFLLKKKFNKFNYLGIIKFGYELLSKLKLDKSNVKGIYFRHVVLLPVIVLIKFFLPQIKIFYEIHREVNSHFGRFCEEHLINKGARLVTISGVLKKIYLSKYKHLEDENVLIVHDGVDLNKFNLQIEKNEAKQITSIIKNRPAIVYVGSLWLIKGVDIMLEAARELPQYNFYLVGKQKPDFEEIVNSYSNLKNLYIIGAVNHDEVPLFLRAADLLVVPHPKNSLSQSPLKLFEYMASGTPILCSDLENLREVTPKQNLFFKPSDLNDFMSKIQIFFNNQKTYKEVSIKNIKTSEKYSWEKRSNSIRNFIINS